jgi:hypothetical protein
LDALIAGDVAYNGIHQWLAQTDHEKRLQWIASVEQIEALKPNIVVAGHTRPNVRDDDPATILGATKTYIRDFDTSLSESRPTRTCKLREVMATRSMFNPPTRKPSSAVGAKSMLISCLWQPYR